MLSFVPWPVVLRSLARPLLILLAGRLPLKENALTGQAGPAHRSSLWTGTLAVILRRCQCLSPSGDLSRKGPDQGASSKETAKAINRPRAFQAAYNREGKGQARPLKVVRRGGGASVPATMVRKGRASEDQETSDQPMCPHSSFIKTL